MAKTTGLTPKKRKSQAVRIRKPGHASTDPDRPLPGAKKAGFYRDKAKINLLNLYNSKPNKALSKEQPLEPVRIQPDRRWFGNTRVVTQTKLEQFREAMDKANKDPYSIILKRSKLPVSLFGSDNSKDSKRTSSNSGILMLEPFEKTFGKKHQRKRARLGLENLEQLAAEVERKQSVYNEDEDHSLCITEPASKDATSEEIFKKGTSRRIWQELYKVVDCSDIIVQVIDARDPMGTRCKSLENHIRKDRPNKHVILLMNKCDLVPAWCSSRWVKILASEYPTIAFHSSLTNSFGKLALLNLLRQYVSLMKDRKHVSVGFVGYPNVGKSSVINTLRQKKVCKAAPVPGETKIWQYVALTHKVHLIDCPGVVPSDPAEDDNDTAKVLKGVVRAERISMPEQHIGEVLARAKREDIIKKYELSNNAEWNNAEEFLTILARRQGKLLKGGEADISTAARVVLYDWQRGRIPYFVCPPYSRDRNIEKEDDNENEGLAELESPTVHNVEKDDQ